MDEKDRIMELYGQSSDALDRIRLFLRYRELRDRFDVVEREPQTPQDDWSLFEKSRSDHSSLRFLVNAVRTFLAGFGRSA